MDLLASAACSDGRYISENIAQPTVNHYLSDVRRDFREYPRARQVSNSRRSEWMNLSREGTFSLLVFFPSVRQSSSLIAACRNGSEEANGSVDRRRSQKCPFDMVVARLPEWFHVSSCATRADRGRTRAAARQGRGDRITREMGWRKINLPFALKRKREDNLDNRRRWSYLSSEKTARRASPCITVRTEMYKWLATLAFFWPLMNGSEILTTIRTCFDLYTYLLDILPTDSWMMIKIETDWSMYSVLRFFAKTSWTAGQGKLSLLFCTWSTWKRQMVCTGGKGGGGRPRLPRRNGRELSGLTVVLLAAS